MLLESNSPELRGIFPRRWLMDVCGIPSIIEVYADWLLQEIDAQAEIHYPILKIIKGWRRAEIIAYLENQDWTKDIHL